MDKMKVGGYVLLETVLAMIAFSMLSMAFFTIFSGQFSMINSSRDAMQAQQYAEIDAQKLRLMNYYDLEDEGAKSRSAMTSWSNPDNVWEDEITIGNEIIIDDYTESKQRIATIKIYRQGDTLARFSMEVPISSQNSGGGVPIGGIVAWGVEGNPQYDGGTYLECDGSTFDTNKFKRLYEVLGTNRVPNYQGMFLRGHGGQAVADDKTREVFTGIDKPTKVVSSVYHEAAKEVGGIQYDTTRPMCEYLGHFQGNGLVGNDTLGYQNSGNLFCFVNDDNKFGVSSFPFLRDVMNESAPSIVNNLARFGATSDLVSAGGYNIFDGGWYNALTKYKYRLEFERSVSETGESYISDVMLVQEEEHPTLSFNNSHISGAFDVERVMPVSDEIRPVNVAVKFMIKAK